MIDRRVLFRAARLFNRKLYFECHEWLEDAWRDAAGQEKQFLQGLIMVSAGMYHLVGGNDPGAVRLFEKGLVRLEPFVPERYGLDVESLVSATRSVLVKARRRLEGEDVVWADEGLPQMNRPGRR